MSIKFERIGFTSATLSNLIIFTLCIVDQRAWVTWVREGSVLSMVLSGTNILGLISCVVLIINLSLRSREYWKARIISMSLYLLSLSLLGSTGL